jgi:copper chaperone CopZ
VTETGTFTASGQVEAELVVTGMTCGACAARIERRLNRLDGVTATVNYATRRAYFTSLGGREPVELIGVINSTGYQATLPTPPDEGAWPLHRAALAGLGCATSACAPYSSPVTTSRPRRPWPGRSGS